VKKEKTEQPQVEQNDMLPEYDFTGRKGTRGKYYRAYRQAHTVRIMELVQHVSRTDLARNLQQVIRAVQRGRMAVVETHGEPEIAIMDITDFRILRAVMRRYVQETRVEVSEGLADASVSALSDVQERYNLVMAHYLAGAISLSRAAELLNMPWLELRARFLRLDVPLRAAPADLDEALADVETAAAWTVAG
jgi:predicted HTH domain antitoxin